MDAFAQEPAACSDGDDNDGDELVDDEDPGCESEMDNDETDPPPPPFECSDGQDNDFDSKVDFGSGFNNDPGCSSADDDDENDPEQCADGRDNDGDGKVDYGQTDDNDPHCSSELDNTEAAQCADGQDNDDDGKIDYPDDVGCKTADDNREASTLTTEDLSGAPDPTSLAQTLAGPGVGISNVSFTGGERGGGTFSDGAGILMSTRVWL